MQLQSQLKSLAEKIGKLKNRIDTEESTKHAFVLPFINLLGYDTFNPTEVVPEFTADVGLKKGEKVDYAIFQNEEPIIIIECKNWKEKLNAHNSQLFRYFHTTKTRFALLTNGIERNQEVDCRRIAITFLSFCSAFCQRGVFRSAYRKGNGGIY